MTDPRARLLDALDEALGRLRRMSPDTERIPHAGTSHDVDMDVVVVSESTELLAHHRQARLTEVTEIRQALGRVDDGTWGTCTGCGEPIAPQRLNARPWAERCVRCQERVEREAAADPERIGIVRVVRPTRPLEELEADGAR